ncbi:MAG: YidC/Oxa1 family insertase periplasmic-domain containing protein [Phycisphaerae bacterium]|jgi:YidC/Oxa1 family membrane protein insertase
MKVILPLAAVVLCLFFVPMNPAFGGDANIPAEEQPQLIGADDKVFFGADSAPAAGVTLGSTDPNSGFKFELELTSKGASVAKATFSEFDNRDPDPEKREKLVFLSPVKQPYSEVLSMANKEFIFVQHQQQLPLDRLNWQSFDVDTLPDGSQTARFETTIKNDGNGSPAIKLVKTYKIVPDSYLLACELTIENLTSTEQKIRFNLTGPVGISREDASRDDEKVVAGFMDSKGGVVTARLDAKKLSKAKSFDDRKLTRVGDDFLWAAVTNKYFAGILVPVPDEGTDFCDWVTDKSGQFYNPDGQLDTGDETIGVDFRIASTVLASAGQAENARTYNFQLYLGPKDKAMFDKNEMYSRLGFFQTIDFMSCCCPAAMIQPLAFGILAIMKWMYGFIGNYGIVIIILVFLMRLIMHPVTKKSQVSMSKMGKLAPMAEEIKKKYASNKAEMNKKLMALYKEHGASPIMGMLPMFVQMPIWIALWSAVYTSIDLRGAEFLPFWITDLSVPDALIRFATVTVPLVGWKIDSFNLLPILMGVAFYLQQKLTPQTSAAATPEAAQQQKMMMMMPLLFPLMLYKAPSGVNLYIMASTFAGVIEQYVIKKHIREKEEAESQGLVAVTSKTGGKVKKKKPKPFFKT